MRMSDRSLTAKTEGIRQAKIALTDMQLNQGTLAARLGVTRQPIGKFFRGEPVSNELFVQICETLKLNWQVIAGITESEAVLDIDRLVQQTRNAIEPMIREQCGTMRVLDMEQPIELTGDRGIYTNVNILEKLTRLRSESELLEECGIEVFDRFGLGRTIKRLPGLKAVQQHRRLMVLGKPGAGKTTFLKYLAMQCITERFAADRVPFFVTLKDFAEAESKLGLVDFLMGGDRETLHQILTAGKALVLLDGLDEVREEDTGQVIRAMRDAADQYQESQFVITCRIAAKEYTFERFTEVEVADFNQEQIATFAENWFRAKNDLPKAESFVNRLKENKPILELASSPLLLTLLCLVFGNGNDFPHNRADLYEEGVKILLKKWDAKRNIQRDELYKKLDVQRREDLLSYVALQTFQQKEYFIKNRRMERYIADFISNLRDVDPDPDSLRVDSEAVLRSIQAQHGLLVEQARGIYSFSHLTFQEYFSAREIVTTNQVLMIVPQVSEKRWREVFLLTVGMLRSADDLLLMMKTHIDLVVAEDDKIQLLLTWANNKEEDAQESGASYKGVAIRAFYLSLNAENLVNILHFLDGSLSSDFAWFSGEHSIDPRVEDEYLEAMNDYYENENIRTLYGAYEDDYDSSQQEENAPPVDSSFVTDVTESLSRFLALDYHLQQGLDEFLPTAYSPNFESFIYSYCKKDFVFDRPTTFEHSQELTDHLQELTTVLSVFCKSINEVKEMSGEYKEKLKRWWTLDCPTWVSELIDILIRDRNIGHDWQFTDAQKHLLQQYYDANLLLVECLNSDCYVSRSVRQEIEDTLLLPMDILKERAAR
jgi:predicted NACHT family NTPase